MKRRYFGTDGVRGLVGKAPITPEFVMKLGYAAGKVLTRTATSSGTPRVLIGKDTRVSGYMLEASLQAGLSAAGVDVMMSRSLPTPAVAYLTRALRLSAGIVISASHNPYHDNGIKFFSASGNKLPDDMEFEIESLIDKPMDCASSENLGKTYRMDDAQGRYIEFCKSTFPANYDLRGMKIVVDCANGAAYNIAPCVFHELGADVISIGAEPNGLNINDNCGATSVGSLVSAVLENGADLGIALDGDADRLVMVDADGKIYDGDQLLYLITKDRLAYSDVKGVVGTLMTNMGLEVALKERQIGFVRANVGDRYVLETLLEKGWLLGGEGSGHLICLDKHSTGDGIISALQVLAALRRHKTTMPAFISELKMYPQVLVNVRIAPGFNWKENVALQAAKQKAEEKLGNRGRVLIRPSGTEPLIRIMVEAEDAAEAKELAQQIASQCPSA